MQVFHDFEILAISFPFNSSLSPNTSAGLNSAIAMLPTRVGFYIKSKRTLIKKRPPIGAFGGVSHKTSSSQKTAWVGSFRRAMTNCEREGWLAAFGCGFNRSMLI
jgi:hypothetical protein